MKTLEEIRNEIDEIDGKMARLFEQRMDCVTAVAEYKYKKCEKIFDPQREKMVIRKNSEKMSRSDYKEAYGKFLQALMDHSKEFQKKWIDTQEDTEKS